MRTERRFRAVDTRAPLRPPPKPPLGLAIVGLGVISRYYLRAIHERSDVRVVSVCDLKRSTARALGHHHPARFYTDFHDAITNPDVDGVVINVPNAMHFDICRAALEAGKHVLCEKPLATTSADADALAVLAQEQDRVLFTAFHRRYNSNICKLANIAPEIVAVHVDYLERIEDHCGDDSWYLDPTQTGGGCVADNGPNAFDALTLLIGPLRVEAAEIERDRRGNDIRALVRLRSQSGAEAVVLLDWAYLAGEKKGVAVRTRKGYVLYSNMLDRFPEFKSSLFHEYEGVVDAFVDAAAGALHIDNGAEMVRLVEETYRVAAEVTRIEACTVLS